MTHCEYVTLKGSQCTNRGKTIYDGKFVCDIHLKTIKANDDCPICLDKLTPHTRVDACGYKHYFHSECLKKCTNKYICPTCKQQITNKAFCKVYEQDQKAILQKVYQLDCKQQHILFDYIIILTMILSMFDLDDAINIVKCMYEITKLSEPYRKSYIKKMFNKFFDS